MLTKINRISNHSEINKNKKSILLEHFDQVKAIKNQISLDIYNYLKLDTFNEELLSFNNFYPDFKPFHLAKYLNSLQSSLKENYLTANEIQKVAKSITHMYENTYSDITSSFKFKIQSNVTVKLYKRKTKSNNVGDVKLFQLEFKTTKLTNLMNYLKFINIDKLMKKEFNFINIIDNLIEQLSLIEDEKKRKTLLNKISVFTDFQEHLEKLYLNEDKFNKIIVIQSLLRKKIKKRINLIELSTGAYIKVPVFNKNSSKPTYHSHVIFDDTNSLYKYWYKFKTPEQTIFVPLAYNEKYHKEFKNVEMDREIYVSLSPKNKINFNLNVNVQEPVFIEENRKMVGIDLNVRDNFCTIGDGINIKEFDYNRKYIQEFVDELIKIDKLSKTDKALEINKNRLKKLIRVNEWYFKGLISEILKELSKDGVTDVVMEDLDLSKSSASYVKSEEFQIKYSRLIRLLRLGNIKNWVKEQAEKYGIRVHLTNPAYTSQECRKCHHIENSNRNGAKFICKVCNHTEHSDYNSPQNILSRVTQDVLARILHNSDEYGRLSPKMINHKTVKQILCDFYMVES